MSPLPKPDTQSWSRSDGRWYHCRPVTDLFGYVVVLIAHGGAGGRTRIRTVPVSDEAEALAVIDKIGKRRRVHGYDQTNHTALS